MVVILNTSPVSQLDVMQWHTSYSSQHWHRSQTKSPLDYKIFEWPIRIMYHFIQLGSHMSWAPPKSWNIMGVTENLVECWNHLEVKNDNNNNNNQIFPVANIVVSTYFLQKDQVSDNVIVESAFSSRCLPNTHLYSHISIDSIRSKLPSSQSLLLSCQNALLL